MKQAEIQKIIEKQVTCGRGYSHDIAIPERFLHHPIGIQLDLFCKEYKDKSILELRKLTNQINNMIGYLESINFPLESIQTPEQFQGALNFCPLLQQYNHSKIETSIISGLLRRIRF